MAEAIKYESALPALLTQLMGTTQKTSGGGSSSTSSTSSSANIDPLMQIFGQQAASSTPEGMQAMLQQLFTQGAQQVPGLTQQFANSSGSRVAGNSGLNLALGDLNKTLASQAAQLMMQQQAQAAGTAGQIAQATRGQTTTQSSTPNQQTVQTGNPKAAGLATLGGLGLNAADKLGLLKGLKGSIGGAASAGGSPFEVNFPSSGVLSDSAGGLATPNYDVADVASFSGNGDQFGNYGESLSGLGESASNIGGSLMDAGSMLWDGAGDLASEAGTQIADAAGGLFDDFSSWFADGGLVKVESLHERRRAALEEAEAAANRGEDSNAAYQKRMGQQGASGNGSKEKPVKKADGGVIRNRNNMGGPLNRGMGSGALNFQGQTQQSVTDVASRPTGSTGASGTSGNSGNSLTTAQLQSNPELLAKLLDKETGASAMAGPNGTIGTPSQNAAVLGGIANSVVGGMLGPLGALGMSALTGQKSIQSLAVNALAAELGLTSLAPGLTASGLGGSAAGAGEADPGVAAGTQDALTGFLGLNDNFGTSAPDSNSGQTGAEGGGIGGSGNSAGSSDAPGGIGGSNGGDAVAADGGKMKGPGTGISDSIHARLSDGEYVLSKDVVDIVGVPFLDSLQHRFHTPAAIQRMQRGG
jgi:hypothetical protein